MLKYSEFLTEENVMNNPNFKKWFGKSKVVDKDGNPLVVYHGTDAIFTEFNPELTGRGADQLGSGFYFTDSEDTAKGYETSTNKSARPSKGPVDPRTLRVYLSIQNPIILDANVDNLNDIKVSREQAFALISKAPNIFNATKSPFVDMIDNQGRPYTLRHIEKVVDSYVDNFQTIERDLYPNNSSAFRKAVKSVMKYDGVIKKFSFGENHYVAWFPEQIKSVDNKGTFSKTSNNIYEDNFND